MDIVFIACFGAIVGSFINVVIERMPLENDVVFKKSHCLKCKTNIQWFDNIPIISFLVLRGRCRKCSASYSVRYFFVESVSAIAMIYFYYSFFLPGNSAYFALSSIVFFHFLAHFFIDLKHHLLLDKINISLLIVALVYTFYTQDFMSALWGALLGGGLTYGVTLLFYYTRGVVGLGGGDIKLYFILGVLLGPEGVIVNIFLSCFLGSVVGLLLIALKRMKKNEPLAFGPSIILAAVFQLFFPDYYSQFLRIIF